VALLSLLHNIVMTIGKSPIDDAISNLLLVEVQNSLVRDNV